MTSNVIPVLETVGAQIGERVLMGNVWAGVVLVAVLLCDRLLARRIAPAWRIALYLLVLARLAGPIDWHLPLGLWSPSARPIASVSYLGSTQDWKPRAAAPSESALSVDVVGITWRTGVALAYGVGVGSLLAMWLRGRMALGRLAQETHRHATVNSLAIWSHPTLGPVLMGVVRPKLIVPAWLLEPRHARSLAHVVAHERAHVRRFDPCLAALLHAACIAAWPIAAVWIAASRVRGLIEQAADAHATRVDAGRVEYARTLLEVAQRASLSRLTPSALAFGGDVRSRIRTLATLTTHWPRGVQAAACALLALITLACATVQQPSTAISAGKVGTPAPSAGVIVEATIFNCKPSHPALTWQTSQGTPDLNPSPRTSVGTMALSDAQLREIIAGLNPAQGQAVVSRPRVAMADFQPAAITIGDSDTGDGYSLTLTHAPSSTHPDLFTVSFAWQKGGVTRPDIKDAQIDLPAGSNRAILLGSPTGRGFNLLCLHRDGTSTAPTLTAAAPGATVRWDLRIHHVSASITPKQIVMGDIRSMEGGKTIAVLGNEFLARFEDNMSGLDGHEIVAVPTIVALDRQRASVEVAGEDGGSNVGGYTIDLTWSSGKAREHAQLVWTIDGTVNRMSIAEWIEDNQSIIAVQRAKDGSLYALLATPTFTSPRPPAPPGR